MECQPGRRKEKLAVKGAVDSTASGSKNPDREDDNWSPRATITKEESERVKLTAAESHEGEEVASEIQPSSNEAEDSFTKCEVEEQQAARAKVQAPRRRRAVIRVESKKRKTRFQEGAVMEISVRKQWRRLALCRAR